MTTRKYTSRSQQTTLTGSVTSGATVIPVVSATTLLGGATISTGQTFTVVIDPDTALEEVIDVTVISSNNLTVTRAIDGSTAQDHSAGAVVRHMIVGRDLRESNLHIEASTYYNDGTSGTKALHGLGTSDGAVVGSTQTVALTNKTIDATSNTVLNIADANVKTGAAIAASKIAGTAVTQADTGTVTSAMIADGTIVNADINASAAIAATKIAGTAVTQADTGTVTSAMIADGTIVNADINAAAAIALSKLAVDPLARANHTGTQTASTISNFDTQVRTSTLNQMAAPTVDLSINTHKLTNVVDPTVAQDAATKNYVDTKIATLVNGAPSTLDQLNELANAIANDPNYSTTITTALSTKLPLAGGTMSGAIAMGTNKITGMGDPTVAQDAATKNYVDTAAASQVAQAATSAASAATSATSAAASATAAAASAATASTAATNAAASQTAAATSATSAAASATAAAGSATTASNSAATASTAATNAAASATAAATSATSAAASATAAATSATSAAASASTASNSASTASTQATNAAASATAAATSATSAAASATAAAASAATASTAASNASTYATNANNSASAAATSATSAAASATAAATSATSAATSATSSASSFTSIDQKYLGAKASAPTLNNQGGALATGAQYWNSSNNTMYVWNGSSWAAATATANITMYRYTASGGETSKSGADDNSATLAYAVGFEQVYVNGVLLVRGLDYTASTGSSITGLTPLVANDVLVVLAFTAFSVANAVPLSTYTAKGDVAVGTGASTVGTLGVGADGSTLVANSSASTGVSWAGPTFIAGKNKIINGDFGIWQRGTGTTSTTYGIYSGADRFGYSSIGGTSTVSQQTFTLGAAPLSGYESTYFSRYTIGSGVSIADMGQKIEDVRVFAGQTITFSFWAKSLTAAQVTPYIYQNFGSGGSAQGSTAGTAISLTSSWVRYSQTFSVPSISGKTIGTGSFLGAYLSSVGTIPGSVIDTWGWQVEAGSVATPFTTATGTLQGELAACRRYLPAIPTGYQTFMGYAYGTNAGIYAIPFDVMARVAPTGITTSTVSNFVIYTSTNGNGSISALNFDAAGTAGASVTAVATLTAGTPSRLFTNGAGYILFTGCEL